MSKYAIDFDGVLWDGEQIRVEAAGKIQRLKDEGN